MKRVLYILTVLSLIVVSISGCNNSNGIINETGGETEKKVGIETNPHIRNSAEMRYLHFEDLLVDVTDLIEGVFISQTEKDGIFYYEFNVVKSLRGKSTGKTIIVQSVPADYTITGTDIKYSTYDVNYEYGKSYLLLLSRHSSVYTEGDVFSFVNDSLIIPLDTLSISNSASEDMSLYGKKLGDQLKDQATISAINQGNMKEYILANCNSKLQ